MIPILLCITVIVFTILYLAPGDPVEYILDDSLTPETYAEKAHELGLDRPFIVQLGDYIWKLVTRLDFGKSYLTGKSINSELKSRFPVSASLGFSSVILMVLFGIPIGAITAVKQNSALDIGWRVIAIILAAIPGFVLALLGLLLFGVKLRWLPIAGLGSFKAWILPVATSSLPGIASLSRMTRTTMLEVIRQDYIIMARAKGLKERVIIMKHALLNALIPLITVVGGMVGHCFSGSVIIETVFTIRGLGSYLNSGISSRDYPIVLGGVLLTAFSVCIFNLIVDIIYAFVDPRIKAQYTTGKKTVRKTAANDSKAVSEVA